MVKYETISILFSINILNLVIVKYFLITLLISSCAQPQNFSDCEKRIINLQKDFEKKSDTLLSELDEHNAFDSLGDVARAVFLIDSIISMIDSHIELFPSSSHDYSLGRTNLVNTGQGQELDRLMRNKFTTEYIYGYSPSFRNYRFESEYWVEAFCYILPSETKLKLSILKYELLLFGFNVHILKS